MPLTGLVSHMVRERWGGAGLAAGWRQALVDTVHGGNQAPSGIKGNDMRLGLESIFPAACKTL